MAWWRFWGGTSARLGLEPPASVPSTPPERSDARSVPLFDRWAVHEGRGLTPKRIVSLYADAEAGFPAGQCDLFEDVIERDAHLRSQLEGRLLAVAGKPLVVQAGGDGAEDVRAAQLFADALAGVPNLRAMVAHQLKALWYGYAATEIDWGYRDGVVVPTWFRNVPHRRIRFDEQAGGAPRLLTDAYSGTGVPLAPGKWIWAEALGRQPARVGLLRTATWWSYFKTLAVRDWIVFSERFGIPYVVGRYEEHATDEDKAKLAEAVQALGRDGASVFSKLMDIELKQVETGGKATDVQGALTEICNRELSKLISGATTTTETTGQASYAIGRVHQNRAFDLVLADAAQLEERLEQDLARPFVTYNGLNARPPKLRAHVAPEIDPLTRMRLYSIAANELGMPLDGEQLRQDFQIRRPGAGAEVVVGTKSTPSAAPAEETPI